MRRFFAISLLSIHLLNLGGYALLCWYLVQRSDMQIESQIFANKIDSKKFIEIKVPVHMPTITDWTEYANVEGQFQMNGDYYNYVKLKMTRDTMFFVCIPNETKTRLEKAGNIISKEINAVQPNKKDQTPVLKKISSLSEYKLVAFQYEYYPFGKYLKQNHEVLISKLCDPYISSPGKPPNSVS